MDAKLVLTVFCCLAFAPPGMAQDRGSAGVQKSKLSKKNKETNAQEKATNAESSGNADVETIEELLLEPAEGEKTSVGDLPKANVHLLAGRTSLGFALPSGGSTFSEGAAGMRFFLQDAVALSLAAVLALDKQSEKSSFGVAARFQAFWSEAGQAVPFFWASFSGGKNTGAGYPKNQQGLVFGPSLGLGVEVFLLKSLSLSGETGLSTQLLPTDKLRVVTGTSALAVNLFLGDQP